MSDHSLINIEFELPGTSKGGRGYWKFNNDLLSNLDYIELFKTTINKIKSDPYITDKCILWEHTKCQIRTETIQYAIRRATSDYFSAKSKLHLEHLQVNENICKRNCNTVQLFKQST